MPSESVVVVPRELPSAKISTVVPATAVPVKVGVGSLVIVLDPGLITGAANAMHSGNRWAYWFLHIE